MKRTFSIYALLLLFVTITLVQLLSVGRVRAATFTVTTAADNGDNVNPTPDSLRKAIIDANNSAGFDTISFNIPAAGVQTINLLAALPTITDPVIIDGYTQPGASANTLAIGGDATLLIELNGTSGGANGLHITAGGSTVRGLVINRFTGIGIRLETNGANTIEGCYIGTNAAGTAKLNNTSVGVFINATPNNLIGGTTPAARNVLSGNLQGVQVASSSATGNTVQGNYVGMDKTGTVALGNTPGDGIQINGGANNNIIGGTAVGAGNVISGNAQDGVSLFGANNNTVQGNLIGTDATGTLDRGNTRIGVIIRSTSSGNTIGGTVAGARNVISGNNDAGIDMEEAASNNTVQGNYIGTDINGNADLGNSLNGILLLAGTNNTIGGSATGARNVISGNNQFGIRLLGSTGTQILGNFIGTNAAGTAAIGNSFSGIEVNGGASSVTIGGTVGTTPGGACTGACNLISGNQSGIVHVNGGATIIQGNYIGTDINGNADLGNNSAGISISSNASGDTVGGTSATARNIVSGNNSNGIEIGGGGGNAITGNYIGLNSAGTAALGNSGIGVSISSSGNTIGGTVAGAGNVISGHSNSPGIQIDIAVNNTVQGNFIGTNSSGTLALGNQTGILLGGNSSSSLIGGTAAGARNIISGNATDGVLIGRPSTSQTFSSSNNTVMANFIGTDVTGTADLGNGGNGVVLRDSANNTIGGATAGERNLISGNNGSGIRLDKAALGGVTTGNVVRGNYIGTDAAGTGALGNSLSGVLIADSSTTNNTVGGTAVGQGNVIAFNGGTGVSVTTSATGNAIRGNSIFSNTTLGLDLDVIGVTANDGCDADVGSNNRQNFPIIISATNLADAVRIEGTLNSTAGTTFNLDFFVSPGCDSSGSGEGQTYIGSAIVTTGAADCIADFTGINAITLPVASLAAGQRITATATDPSGNTSEFSSCSGPTAIEVASFVATGFESGVLLEWQTGYEVNNLGFNIYREQLGRRELVNPQMVAGSALVAASGIVIKAGRSYTWWDKGIGDCRNATYWLEDLDINGKSTMHGPFVVKANGGLRPTRSQAAFLSQLSESQPFFTATASSFFGEDSGSKASLKAIQSSGPSSASMAASPASGPAVKLGVREQGWYRVTQAELLAAGLDPDANPRNLQLFLGGVQQSLLVTGESDGRLDPTDVVEFYGKGTDTTSTDTRVYWLVAGKERGKRINIIPSHGKPGGAHSFSYTVERKERSIYFSGLLNGEAENFFGRVVSQPVEQTIPLRHLDTTSSSAEVEVALQGVTDLNGTEDHQVAVAVNEVMIGRMVFDGRAHKIERFSIYATMLKEGENTVTLTGQGGSDVTLVDYVRISYDHTYVADSDELRLTASVKRGATQTIEGFSTPLIRVMDVSDPSGVQELAGQIETMTGEGFGVTVDVAGSDPRTLMSFGEGQVKRPASITANQASSWRSEKNGADMLIITRRELEASLEPLRVLRQGQGLSVAVVDIEDVYDEFSFGEKTPQSLKDFVNYAGTRWKRKPRYVMLAGDASFDPRNYLGFGDNDVVPTKLVDTVFMETASDEWLGDYDNDGLAEVAVGRLPVRTAAEASMMALKIVGYERSSPSEEVLLVSDESSGYDFEEASTHLIPLVPANLRVSRIHRGGIDPEAEKKTLLEAIDRGQKIVNYAGHGSVDRWSGSLLTGSEARRLENKGRLSLFVMMTCLNGYFHDPSLDSLSEALLKAEGGAVSVWTSTGMTVPIDQWTMNQEFYRLVFGSAGVNGQTLTIGEAAMRAKARITDPDIRRTWVLLGDPAMKLK